jgi:transcriptional regulator with XRE-family HTH domain
VPSVAVRRDRLRAARERAGLSQEELAQAIPRRDGRPGGIATSTAWRWENGLSTPYPYQRPSLAKALGVSLDELDDLLEVAPTATAANYVDDSAGPATGEEELAQLHAETRHLIALDGQHGGNDLVGLAVRLFRGSRARLATRRHAPGLERDLAAATGEAGQVAAWVAFDANRQSLSRQLAHEALVVSRLAGDRSMELFELAHLAMQDIHQHQPAEALRLVDVVLSERVSGRTRALFHVRRARALAQTGARAAAFDTLAHGRALLADGIAGDDPPWTWWLDDAELIGHEALMHADLDEWHQALDGFQAAYGTRPVVRGQAGVGRTRVSYYDLARVFDAQVRVQAWADAGESVQRLLPMTADVGSRRTGVLLLDALGRVDRARAGSTVVDAGDALQEALVVASGD